MSDDSTIGSVRNDLGRAEAQSHVKKILANLAIRTMAFFAYEMSASISTSDAALIFVTSAQKTLDFRIALGNYLIQACNHGAQRRVTTNMEKTH